MAFVRIVGDTLIVAASDRLFVSNGNEAAFELISSVDTKPTTSGASNDRDDDDDDDDERERTVQKNSDASTATLVQVLALAISSPPFHVAIANSRKQVLVYNSGNQLTCCINVQKQVTAMCFVQADGCLVVADRAGYVHKYDFRTESTPAAHFLLGHVSLLLDICMTPNEQYLVTCDRDEKVRVSNYPNAYNIESYCLGHTEYVRSLCVLPFDDERSMLFSADGAGVIKAWEPASGRCVMTVDVSARLGHSFSIRKIIGVRRDAKSGLQLAICAENTCSVVFLTVTTAEGGTGHLSVAEHRSWTSNDAALRIWDMCWLDHDQVLVLTACSERPLRLIGHQSGKSEALGEVHNVGDCSSPLIQAAVQQLNSSQNFLKCLSAAKDELPPLQKTHFNNVEDYRKRKQEQIQGHKEKKVKTSS